MVKRIYLFFNWGWLEFNAVKHFGTEYVHAGVDFVGDEFLRFLDEASDATSVFVEDHAVLWRFLHLGNTNGALAAVRLVERNHLREGEVADYVRVKYEEGLVGGRHQQCPGESQGSGRPKRLRFQREQQLDLCVSSKISNANLLATQAPYMKIKCVFKCINSCFKIAFVVNFDFQKKELFFSRDFAMQAMKI